MSKRMNKERAREILEKIKSKSEEYIKNSQTRINTTDLTPLKNAFVRKQEYAKEKVQALDIAIESLETRYQMNDKGEITPIDNEWVDVRDRLPSEDKDYFVTIKSRIDYADRYYIVLAHWEKSTTDKSVKGWWTSIGWNRAEEQHLYDITNDVVAWKKVESYERKE